MYVRIKQRDKSGEFQMSDIMCTRRTMKPRQNQKVSRKFWKLISTRSLISKPTRYFSNNGHNHIFNLSYRAISPFPTVFSTQLEIFLPFSSKRKMSSANSFSLKESKICHLGKSKAKNWFLQCILYILT